MTHTASQDLPGGPISLTISIAPHRIEVHNRSMNTGARPCRMLMFGAFGIHQEYIDGRGDGRGRLWFLTHAASGLRSKVFDELADAVYAAGVLMGTGFDWNKITSFEEAQALKGTEPWRAVVTALNQHCGHLFTEE